MRTVPHVEPKPFRQCEVTKHGVPHEQIVAARRQELVGEREEPRYPVPQLPLDRAGIRPLRR